MNTRQTVARALVATLTLSAAGFATWKANEGDGPTAVRPDGVVVHHPYVPTQGDVPTIGHGSTRYEDGTPVRLSDAPITRERAQQLARNLHSEEEARFKASLPGVSLYPGEYDLYLDFVGQYGIGNWRTSSMRRHLLAGEYVRACQALLKSQAKPEELTEEMFASELYTAGMPDPDLILRTSGEQRLSNYLLFQSAYSELYFTDVAWPDFHAPELHAALEEFGRRQRRCGSTGENNA